MKCIIKVISKLLLILILTITTLLARTQTVEASFWSDMFGQAGDFIEQGEKEAAAEQDTSDAQTAEVITILYNTLMSLGSVIAVGIGGALGIKFMTSSAEDKAKVKESMVPYVIGCAVIFGSLVIWKISMTLFSQI